MTIYDQTIDTFDLFTPGYLTQRGYRFAGPLQWRDGVACVPVAPLREPLQVGQRVRVTERIKAVDSAWMLRAGAMGKISRVDMFGAAWVDFGNGIEIEFDALIMQPQPGGEEAA
jgi:hypothetical protein